MKSKATPQLLAQLRTIQSEYDLLAFLNAIANWFPENETVGDALLDCILILDDRVNNTCE